MARDKYPNKVMTSIPEETSRKLGMIAIASGLTKDEIYSLSLSFAANHDDFFKVLDAYKQVDTIAQAETVDMLRMTHPVSFTEKEHDYLMKNIHEYENSPVMKIIEDPRD